MREQLRRALDRMVYAGCHRSIIYNMLSILLAVAAVDIGVVARASLQCGCTNGGSSVRAVTRKGWCEHWI